MVSAVVSPPSWRFLSAAVTGERNEEQEISLPVIKILTMHSGGVETNTRQKWTFNTKN